MDKNNKNEQRGKILLSAFFVIFHSQHPAIALLLAMQGWADGWLVFVQHCHGRTRQSVCPHPEIGELRNRVPALMAATAGMVKAV